MTTIVRNESTGPLPDGFKTSPKPLELHEKLPHYAPTPLVDAPSIAERLGLSRVLVKDESQRFGMPSFKLLGASWATYQALINYIGRDPAPWVDIDGLREQVAPLRPFTLAAATDGNHGRAVARMAKLLGFEAKIFVPAGTTQARIDGIESEGASCTIFDGDYDGTVARSAEEASDRCLVIDDTSWPGYEDIPRWVAEGYATIFYEIDETPDVVFVPLGVGALGAAATDFYKRAAGKTDPTIVGVEPETCASVLASIRKGELVTVPGPHPSMMAGLNCGTPSPVAFPTLKAGLDWCVAVEDSYAEAAMRTLAECGITSGETGAAALAGLEAVMISMTSSNPLQLGKETTALVISTEGATDPAAYERIVGRKPVED
ncbi:MAG: diaminopropionate ammonia-lyase [Acidobacteriota bacterium]|nr:MAG: diaminopropionate ammonia-lyase [Acidobacteriota bacterium]